MPPPDYTDDEWRMLRLDLIRQLTVRGAYRPAALPRREIRTWFAESDRDAVARLLSELDADDDCPVELVGTDDAAVWLTSPEAAERFLSER